MQIIRVIYEELNSRSSTIYNLAATYTTVHTFPTPYAYPFSQTLYLMCIVAY